MISFRSFVGSWYVPSSLSGSFSIVRQTNDAKHLRCWNTRSCSQSEKSLDMFGLLVSWAVRMCTIWKRTAIPQHHCRARTKHETRSPSGTQSHCVRLQNIADYDVVWQGRFTKQYKQYLKQYASLSFEVAKELISFEPKLQSVLQVSVNSEGYFW